MESGDLEARVEALEGQIRDLRGRVRVSEQDAAAARVLAGAADRDVGEIRGEILDFRQGTAASFNALREDFVDLRTYRDRRFEQVDQAFAQVDRGFAEMRGKLDGAAAGQQQIVDLLHTLIGGQGRGNWLRGSRRNAAVSLSARAPAHACAPR